MENLNAEQIIKALECCIAKDDCCGNCPCEKNSGHKLCIDVMAENALALIKSQEQRIAELTEENESLKTQRRVLAVSCKDVYRKVRDAKTDTVRKMQEEVKARCKNLFSGLDVCMIVDQIANELLTEDQK